MNFVSLEYQKVFLILVMSFGKALEAWGGLGRAWGMLWDALGGSVETLGRLWGGSGEALGRLWGA